jgi:hypothetical protein
MCSPFGAHLRDLGCAAQHVRVRLATFTFVRAAGWPRFVFVLRRSRHACLHGACGSRLSFDVCARIRAPVAASSVLANVPRHRLHTFTLRSLLAERARRAHLLVLVSMFVFRRSRPAALHRLTVHGLARSCHVSTAQSSDPLSVRGPPLRAAPVNRARARLATNTIALPYGFLQSPTHLATCRAR